MKYLKVFTDFLQDMEPLDAAERGRLFTAMLLYAETLEEKELPGNERFLWPSARKIIDREMEFLDRKRAAGAAGGLAKASNAKQSLAEVSTGKQTEAKASQKEKDKDKETKETLSIDSEKKEAQRFRAPSLEEVREYCDERHNGIDAASFIAHYQSVGWRIGKAPMKDWKAAVRTWEARRKADRPVTAYSNSELERLEVQL